MSINKDFIKLFFASFLTLFFELICIRWLSSELLYFSYFKNFILISSFAGIGIGCTLAKRKFNLFLFFPFAISTLFICLIHFEAHINNSFVNYSFLKDALWGITVSTNIKQVAISYLVFLSIFFLNMFSFVCLGQLMCRYMLPLKPLTAYSINIVGSLAGILAFNIFSYLSLSPFYWLILGLMISILFLLKNSRLVILSLFIFCYVLFETYNLYHIKQKSIWSPYYKLIVRKKLLPLNTIPNNNPLWGYRIFSNKTGLQHMYNLSKSFTSKYPQAFPNPEYGIFKIMNPKYDLPYKLVTPKNVLVIGGGAGNDAAAALRNGAKNIDVVEIDPKVVEIGTNLHPENPYNSPFVNIIVDDARSYLNKSKIKYDLIVYGYVDSLTMFSNSINVRLEHFLFTLEGLSAAQKLLSENGVIYIGFSRSVTYKYPWINKRIYQSLRKATGKIPLSLFDNSVLLAGNGAEKFLFEKNLFLKEMYSKEKATINQDETLVTDNWPFLHLESKSIPSNYLIMMGLIFIILFLCVKPIILNNININPHFFFLGSAFMLIETKAILSAGLLFGTTWIVNSYVIASILIIILCANVFISKKKTLKNYSCYYYLFAVLIASYFIPHKYFLAFNNSFKHVILCCLIFAPIFLASLIFAKSLKGTRKIDIAFGSNILGALVGGFSEYLSLIFGINALYIVAIAFYFLSFIFRKNITCCS